MAGDFGGGKPQFCFLRGLGEYLTRGGDSSGFPDYAGLMGHGEALFREAVLACFLGGVDPFGGMSMSCRWCCR